MNKGATLADVKEFLMSEKGQPPVDFRYDHRHRRHQSRDSDLAVHYKLPAGTYVMVCFWPDA